MTDPDRLPYGPYGTIYSGFAYQVARQVFKNHPEHSKLFATAQAWGEFMDHFMEAIDQTARRNRLKLPCVKDPEPSNE